MPLNPRQQAFVREYLVDHNATQAAIRAGYSERTAHSAGPRLLEHVGVQRVIAEGEGKLVQRTGVTKDRISQGLMEIAWAPRPAEDEDGEMVPANVRRQALMDLGKLHGHIVERREHRIVNAVDDLSDDELAALEIDIARKLGEGRVRQ